MFSLHKCAVDKALKTTNGHLDLLLRFLVGLSLDSNHYLLERLLVKRTDSLPQEQGRTIEYLKEKIKNMHCPKECFILFHCLNELEDHSLTDEIQRHLSSGKFKHCMPPSLWSALVYFITTSEEKLEEFDLCKYGRSDDILQWLHPAVKLSTKAKLQDCNITVEGCAFLSSVLTSSSRVRALDLSDNNNLQDSGVEMLCVGVTRSHNKSLLLKNCGVTEDGCVLLSNALSLNPSHLRELDLSGNNVGDSGVKHLCAVLENTECALHILKLNKCSVTKEDVAALAEALNSNPSHMTELDLRENQLKESDLNLLATIQDKVIV